MLYVLTICLSGIKSKLLFMKKIFTLLCLTTSLHIASLQATAGSTGLESEGAESTPSKKQIHPGAHNLHSDQNAYWSKFKQKIVDAQTVLEQQASDACDALEALKQQATTAHLFLESKGWTSPEKVSEKVADAGLVLLAAAFMHPYLPAPLRMARSLWTGVKFLGISKGIDLSHAYWQKLSK